MSSSGSSNLVLTRKLSLSDKQRRKQLIAGAAKSIKNNQKRSSNNYNSSPNKNIGRFGCLGGNDDNNINVMSNRGKSDNLNDPGSSTPVSSLELMDTGNIYQILKRILTI